MVQPVIDIRLQASSGGEVRERRRVTVNGRAHAVVAVIVDGEALAHLIGTGQSTAIGGWDRGNTVQLRRSIERELTNSVVLDLSDQIRPVPRLVQRRVFPNASDGSARQLHTLAVRAELAGDIFRAHEFASAAHDAAPSRQSASYLSELDRRLNLTASP
jgi:hypothetical protein